MNAVSHFFVGEPQGATPFVPRWWGLVAYAFYALHAGYFLAHGRPSDLLWGCHMATLGIGTGLLFRSPVFNGLGVLSLVFGTPLWILDFATGGEFFLTSMGTHLGGLALGIAGVRSLGLPRFTWAKLVALTAFLMWISFLLTPASANINLCQGPPTGWEDKFPSYPLFGVIVLGAAALQFFLAELALRWFFQPDEPKGFRRFLRDLHVFGLAGLGLGALFVSFAPLAVLWPTLAWRNHLSLTAGRLCSRLALYLCGVKVEYSGLENLKHPAILTFNHTSYLDFLVNAELTGTRCLVFGKRSLARLPIVGWAWAIGGHPLIQRDDREHWQVQLDRTERLLSEGYSTMVAPEGRRSPSGELLPFKKGPFHLALATRLPIVPVVIKGGAALLWERRSSIPGTIEVRVLPSVSTEDWKTETLDEHVDAIRSIYLSELEGSPVLNGSSRS
ncbi:MAG: 1-acyl-sn-glycerol-3-phosphate acyltransferase [Planctomycetes bacterium]|nr:1-acyl-sn-glycerol-3-phosphate acyltransferase [Planctomycetota bacterium]